MAMPPIHIRKIIEKVIKDAISASKPELLRQKKMQFDMYGANDWDDTRFPALEESTVRRKNGNDLPLLRTGDLQKSLRFGRGKLNVDIDSDVPYAEFADRYISRKGGTHFFNKISPMEERGLEKEIEKQLRIICGSYR